MSQPWRGTIWGAILMPILSMFVCIMSAKNFGTKIICFFEKQKNHIWLSILYLRCKVHVSIYRYTCTLHLTPSCPKKTLQDLVLRPEKAWQFCFRPAIHLQFLGKKELEKFLQYFFCRGIFFFLFLPLFGVKNPRKYCYYLKITTLQNSWNLYFF